MLYPLSYEGGTMERLPPEGVGCSENAAITSIDVTPSTYDRRNGNAPRRRQ